MSCWSFIRSVFNGRMCPAAQQQLAAGFCIFLNGVNFTPVPDTHYTQKKKETEWTT